MIMVLPSTDGPAYALPLSSCVSPCLLYCHFISLHSELAVKPCLVRSYFSYSFFNVFPSCKSSSLLISHHSFGEILASLYWLFFPIPLCSDFSWPDMTGKLLKTDCVLSTICSSSMPFYNAKGLWIFVSAVLYSCYLLSFLIPVKKNQVIPLLRLSRSFPLPEHVNFLNLDSPIEILPVHTTL